MTASLDIPEVNALLAERMAALAEHLVGEPSQRGRDTWRFRRKGSLSIAVAGPKRGAWQDHEAGRGGDPLGLISHIRGQPMREAFRWALDWLGDDRTQHAPRHFPMAPARPPEPSRTLDLARRIWRQAVPADAPGSLVPIYFASRSLRLDPGAPLRFHPACPRGGELLPAMVALMTDAITGQPCGVHRTFLRSDGGGKADGQAKLMAGNAGVIRLTPDEDVTVGLGLAEGVETALSVMQGFGWRPLWAAASAGAISRFPLIPGIAALTIFTDSDGAGLRAAEECAARWRDTGLEARILAPPAGDWNDVHQGAA